MVTLNSLVELLQRQAVPVALSLLILFPFLTHYISTTLFYRKANSRQPRQSPPTIPYWVPGVFHAIGLAVGPAAFFAKLIKEYGSYAPFVVKAGTSSYVVIRDPNHAKEIFQAPQQLTMKTRLAHVHDRVLGSPKEAVKIYQGIGTGHEDSKQVEYAQLALPQKYLTHMPLISLAEVYISTLRRNLSNKMFQVKTWTQIENVWSFFQIEITRAATETLFGSALLKQYPKVVHDFWKFAANHDDLEWVLPQFRMSSTDGIRDQLEENLKKWLQTTHGGPDFAELGDEDPIWDAQKGSRFIQERDQVFANLPSFNYQARAAETLGIIQALIPDIMSSTFWCVVESLRDPDLVKRLTAEMAPFYEVKTGAYDIAAITDLSIVQSLLAETGRLRTATCTIRTNVEAEFKLDDTWTIPKGMSALVFSHDLALNTELWAKARPQTVARPLEEFWAERFLTADSPTPGRKQSSRKSGIGTGRFSMDGVEALHVSFDWDPMRCLTKAMQAATLGVLLTEFELQLCDPEATQAALPLLREVAYGMIKPLDQIAIRIRKRTHSKEST